MRHVWSRPHEYHSSSTWLRDKQLQWWIKKNWKKTPHQSYNVRYSIYICVEDWPFLFFVFSLMKLVSISNYLFSLIISLFIECVVSKWKLKFILTHSFELLFVHKSFTLTLSATHSKFLLTVSSASWVTSLSSRYTCLSFMSRLSPDGHNLQESLSITSANTISPVSRVKEEINHAKYFINCYYWLNLSSCSFMFATQSILHHVK